MEISIPTWNAGTSSYTFRIGKCSHRLEDRVYNEDSNGQINLPASLASRSVIESFVQDFLEGTKKYFTNPLSVEKVFRHLRHSQTETGHPTTTGWFLIQWKPVSFTIKSGDFLIVWEVTDCKPTEPLIPADFTLATTPRAQTPKVPEQPSSDVRSIQIHDSLIPVGDLPLSDLPELSFARTEVDSTREESKRRIREARLKVALAKVKAQRMEYLYIEKYGLPPEDLEESSEDSTSSEEEIPSFERHSH